MIFGGLKSPKGASGGSKISIVIKLVFTSPPIRMPRVLCIKIGRFKICFDPAARQLMELFSDHLGYFIRTWLPILPKSPAFSLIWAGSFATAA